METTKFARCCDECGAGMNEGYCIGGGLEYFCSDECLHKHYTAEEWDEMYDDGEGDSEYTAWEDEDDFLYEEIDGKLTPIGVVSPYDTYNPAQYWEERRRKLNASWFGREN